MTENNSDKRLERLVRRAGVPRGFRPQSDAEIEKLLDTVGGEPYSKDKLARMLAKIRGDHLEARPSAPTPSASAAFASLSESERELAELYRAQGKPLPPELEAKLKEMERRAAEPPPEDKPEHGG